MIKQKQTQVLEIRFPGTINGFNEEFCRLLYQKLKEGWDDNKVCYEADNSGYREILPGWTSIVEHLKLQVKFEYTGTDGCIIKDLLIETESLLRAIE